MTRPTTRRWNWRRTALLALLVVVVLPLLLFTLNGTVLANGERPTAGTYSGTAAEPGDPVVTVASYNVAKGFAHKSGLTFDTTENVQARLRRMADAIRAENPDLVFLSEVMTECSPCPVDQLAFLGRELGLPYWAFGENYCFGLPFCRVVGGNAILSRTPLVPVANPSLAGFKPFWDTSNSRRALFAETTVRGQTVLLAALHTDSFSRANNAVQTRQILAVIGDRPCVLAGDFNARPTDGTLKLVNESGRFCGDTSGPPTFPADAPDRRIDYALAPAAWEHLDTRVIDSTASDHRPVVARFRVR